jgi:hypothetical protein
MRRTVRLSAEASDRYQKFDEENRPLLSDDFFLSKEDAGYFVKEDQAQGYFSASFHEDEADISFCFPRGISFEDACEDLHLLSEQCIRRAHPKKIVCLPEPRYIHVLQACGYYQKGTVYQKKIEPWRIQLRDAVFDQKGYIINQGAMEKIPFGWFTTDAKGCGWIAAYNLLKMCGREQTMQETAEQMGDHALLGAVCGEPLHALYLYLRRKGCGCGLSKPWDGDALKCMQKSRYGILLYTHKDGAHYTAYRSLENGRKLFYNAVYGREDHEETAAGFLAQRELLPFASVIYVI